ETPPFSFKDLRGLSPRALCRNVNDSLTLLSEKDSSLLEQTKFVRFDAIKMLLMARCVLLRFPSATLISTL
ncbi:hypothetical protein, partial [Delftia tsuruhatensis]|uniref:hypothetical protein n=1 Tax=Delftia tsuruhatensis TaxID=180282 RepID=UPI001EF45121